MIEGDPLKILSLGAGVQSSTIFLMSCYGDLEKFDAAIFADTGWESKIVYKWIEFLKAEGENNNIPIYTVSSGNIKEDALISQVRGRSEDGKRWASMPCFTLGPNGERGMIRRQCTSEYKIRPIEKELRRLAGYKKYQRIPPGTVETWKGISTDEIKRASISSVKWIDFYYPLIELGMTRQDCLDWCSKLSLYPPRSSCLGCPYHSKMEWRRLRDDSPLEWKDVVEFDKSIRNCGGMRGHVFIHPDRVPLDEVDLSIPDDYQEQLSIFGDECQGICGV